MFTNIKNYLKSREIKKENLIPFIVFLLIMLAVFVSVKVFGLEFAKVAPIPVIILFSILCMIIWGLAGLAVFRSLFVVSASLSLIIFLAQSYCQSPAYLHTADNSLKSLLGFGILYVGFIFFRSLYKELKESLNKFKDANSGKRSWFVVVLFALFVALFLVQLYQVINPILMGLCVYQ